MESNFIALVNEEYTAEAVEQSWSDRAADWIGDAATTVETSVSLGSVAVAAHVVRNATRIAQALPAQWAASCKKADARMDARLRARGLIK